MNRVPGLWRIPGKTGRVLACALRAALVGGLAVSSTVGAAPVAVRFGDDPEVLAFAREVAERQEIPQATIMRLLKKAVYQPAVLRAIAPPTDPLRRSWQDYRALFVNTTRIEGGVEFRERNAAVLARAYAEFGVPEEIVVAIIGIETVYGRNAGNYRVLDALATLAFHYPPRAKFFRAELEQFLLLTHERSIEPLSVKGSYAGAIGIPQFMPGSVRRFAIDYSGDGRVDLNGNAADAIGSVANFLARHGWVRDLPVSWPAAMSASANAAEVQSLLDEGIKPKFLLRDFAARGVLPAALPTSDANITIATAPPGEALALALIDLPSRMAPTGYRLGSDNFFALTRYNRSNFYAAAVSDLAEELRARLLARHAGTTPREGPAPRAMLRFSAAPR